MTSTRAVRAGILPLACWMLLGQGSALSSGTGPENPPSAQEAERERLGLVRKEIERLQSELEASRRQETGLLGELHSLDLEMDLHRRQGEVLGAEMERCRKEISAKTLRVAGLKARLEGKGRLLAERVRALYVAGPLRFERAVLTARDPGEVVEAHRLASRLAEADGRRIADYRRDLSELHDSLESLESRKATLASLSRQEANRRRELEGVRRNRTRLLEGVRKEAEEHRKALEEMVETERDLQRLVEALSTGGTIRPEWKVGFARFRGLLPWPAPGKILVPFGARVSARYDTRVPHPGVDLEARTGDAIRAVFDGTVAFSDWFKGYGNLVILDHGGGFMTVYAHASQRLVARGDQVVGGQVIALAGDTGSLDGPKLYFEIWRDGKPEDPAAWLARREAGTR